MDNDVKKLLKDILICIDNVNSYTGLKKVFSDYNTDFLLQDAVKEI